MADIEQAACVAPVVGRAAFAKQLMCFLSAVWQIKSVKRIGYTFEDERLDLWVLLRDDLSQDAERISLLDFQFMQATRAPIDLHVFVLKT